MIRYKDGVFRILDNNSKFGTLVKLPEPIEVKEDKVGIQCGRTLITVSLKTGKPLPVDSDMMFDTFNVSDAGEMLPEVLTKQRSNQLSTEKRVAAEIKPAANKEIKELRDGESEGTLDIEEISPLAMPDINRRSKKISKAPKKKQ